jgi:hypothetical protein
LLFSVKILEQRKSHFRKPVNLYLGASSYETKKDFLDGFDILQKGLANQNESLTKSVKRLLDQQKKGEAGGPTA